MTALANLRSGRAGQNFTETSLETRCTAFMPTLFNSR